MIEDLIVEQSLPGLDETIAIKRLKNGDLNGLETLVQRYQVQAVHAAYLIVKDRYLAEDIAQNAFLKAAEKIDQFNGRRAFGPWFMRIVVNAAIKVANRQKREAPLEGEDEDADAFSFHQDTGPSPEEIVEMDETGQVVWQALERLPVEQRAAVVMRHFLEMSDVEMTAALNRPPSAIHWWLRTARSRLREMLRPFWKPGQPGSYDEKQEKK